MCGEYNYNWEKIIGGYLITVVRKDDNKIMVEFKFADLDGEDIIYGTGSIWGSLSTAFTEVVYHMEQEL